MAGNLTTKSDGKCHQARKPVCLPRNVSRKRVSPLLPWGAIIHNHFRQERTLIPMVSVDPDELRTVGEQTLPYIASFYNEMADRLDAVAQQARHGLFPGTSSPAGNALAEAWLECHRFFYAVTEECADSHRAVGLAVVESAAAYQEADEAGEQEFEVTEDELLGTVSTSFAEADAGAYGADDGGYQYASAVDQSGGSNYADQLGDGTGEPADWQDYEVQDGQETRGEETTEWAQQMYEAQQNGSA